MRRPIRRPIQRLMLDLWPVFLLLLLWQLWVSAAGYSSIVLVPPGAVLRDLLNFPGAYLSPALHTLAFALGGLCVGMGLGLLLALAAWLSDLLAGITTPFALLLSSTPVVCLIPVIARLFGYQSRTELIAIALMTFFPSFVYCTAGLRQLPERSGDVLLVLHASRSQTLRLLALPAACPALATALRVGATYSVLVALVAEYLMQTGGLGTLFAVTMQQFQLARALGASALAMALSVALFEATRAVEERVSGVFKDGN
jgi:ABC-type nitrate/sulfonate/bicarbonate transport system permease component